jgi:hypothetical protein
MNALARQYQLARFALFCCLALVPLVKHDVQRSSFGDWDQD